MKCFNGLVGKAIPSAHGPSKKIRTSGLLIPNQALCLTELYLEVGQPELHRGQIIICSHFYSLGLYFKKEAYP